MKNKSFLAVLKKYFEEKKEEEILVGNLDEIVIPMEWIFTEKLDRSIIERALIELLKKGNPIYQKSYVSKNMKDWRKSKEKKDLTGDQKRKSLTEEVEKKIKDLRIRLKKGIINVNAIGLDNWTKVIISENPSPKSKILQISEEEFFNEILKVLKTEDIKNTLSELNLDPEEPNMLQSIFVKENNSNTEELTLDSIRNAMLVAATNLQEYYTWLTEEKKASSYYEISVKQRVDTMDTSKKVNPHPKVDRKNPIIPFMNRRKILEDMKPYVTIGVTEIDEKGEEIPGAYSTFVYQNPQGREGYLMIAEPLEGSRSTRIIYIPKQEFDEFKVVGNTPKLPEILKKYIQMSNKEFIQATHTQQLNHTDETSFQEKIKYIIQGGDRKVYYSKYDANIYGTKITRQDIGGLGESSPKHEVDAAEALLEGAFKENDTKQQGGKND